VYTPYVIFCVLVPCSGLGWPGEVAGRLRGLSLAWIVTLASTRCYSGVVGGRVFGSRFLDMNFAPVLFAALALGHIRRHVGSRFARVVFALMRPGRLSFSRRPRSFDKAGGTPFR